MVKKAKDKRIYNNIQIAAFMDAFGKSHLTIKRWINSNDDRLTSDKAKEALNKIIER